LQKYKTIRAIFLKKHEIFTNRYKRIDEVFICSVYKFSGIKLLG
jgi:hypothetical protein